MVEKEEFNLDDFLLPPEARNMKRKDENSSDEEGDKFLNHNIPRRHTVHGHGLTRTNISNDSLTP